MAGRGRIGMVRVEVRSKICKLAKAVMPSSMVGLTERRKMIAHR